MGLPCGHVVGCSSMRLIAASTLSESTCSHLPASAWASAQLRPRMSVRKRSARRCRRTTRSASAKPRVVSTMPITNDEQRDADMNAVGALTKRGVIGVTIGAVIGALLGFVIAWIVGGSPGWQGGAAVAGLAAGGPLGFVYAGFSGLSVSEEWGETFESAGGETSVAVHATDRGEYERALSALRSTHARRLCT